MNQTHLNLAIRYFIDLSEVFEEKCFSLEYGSKEWQYSRDIYVSLSNSAAQLMGEKVNPFT